MSIEDLQHLTTETRNERTLSLDEMSVIDILKIMNQEDNSVPKAINKELINIEKAINLVVSSFTQGGRLIYIGAGTSGRLGVLDAAECVPTFGTPSDMVIGLIAGGKKAMIEAVEGAEDDKELAVSDLKGIQLSEKDIVVGIAASGRTPYVIGGLEYAKKIGASVIALSCNDQARISDLADIAIEVVVGPEVLTGSTRLKAGTAQKLVLNMISTVSMIKIGKVYENLMIDVNITNDKLKNRAVGIIKEITKVDYDQAVEALELSNNQVKNAVVMLIKDVDYQESERLLKKAEGFVYRII